MTSETNHSKQGESLIFLGFTLFLLGLTVGLFVQNMSNPRMALSAHLEGIMNGIFLAILGLVWPRAALSPALQKLTFWLPVYGAFANLFAVVVAAATGAGKMMPLGAAKKGHNSSKALLTSCLPHWLWQ